MWWGGGRGWRYQLVVELGQARLAVVIEDQHGVDHAAVVDAPAVVLSSPRHNRIHSRSVVHQEMELVLAASLRLARSTGALVGVAAFRATSASSDRRPARASPVRTSRPHCLPPWRSLSSSLARRKKRALIWPSSTLTDGVALYSSRRLTSAEPPSFHTSFVPT